MTQRQKIKLVANVPLNVTLEETNGKECHSQYTGIEYRYNVLHQGTPSILYLLAQGAEALRRSGAQAGDDVQIVKTMRGDTPYFSVRVFSDAVLAVPPPPANGYHDDPPPTHQPATHQPPTQGIRMLAPRTQVAPQPVEAVRPVAAPTPAGGTAVLLAQCLHCAIDAALGAEQFARTKDRTLLFSTEDIRAMALTIYINKAKEASY